MNSGGLRSAIFLRSRLAGTVLFLQRIHFDERRKGFFVFADEAKIFVKGGHGGNGCVAFRREKYVPRGGPSGGDGGNGGSIFLEANINDNTLLRYRYNREFKADRGRHGEGSNCTGHSGDDMVLRVPIGTVVFDAANRTRPSPTWPRPDSACWWRMADTAAAAISILPSRGTRLRANTKKAGPVKSAICGWN